MQHRKIICTCIPTVITTQTACTRTVTSLRARRSYSELADHGIRRFIYRKSQREELIPFEMSFLDFSTASSRPCRSWSQTSHIMLMGLTSGKCLLCVAHTAEQKSQAWSCGPSIISPGFTQSTSLGVEGKSKRVSSLFFPLVEGIRQWVEFPCHYCNAETGCLWKIFSELWWNIPRMVENSEEHLKVLVITFSLHQCQPLVLWEFAVFLFSSLWELMRMPFKKVRKRLPLSSLYLGTSRQSIRIPSFRESGRLLYEKYRRVLSITEARYNRALSVSLPLYSASKAI